MKKTEEFISVAIFASRLGISKSFVYRLAEIGRDAGGVRSIRLGRKAAIRIPASELERLIAEREREEV